MLMFDIGANRGDATVAALNLGYSVVALEPAPRVYAELVRTFIYHPTVIPLRLAVSDTDNERIEFYECVEDGLSTMEKGWLTDPSMPYNGKEFRTIKATTITLDKLVELYGTPDLVKIDVEGAEWAVLKGMTSCMGTIAFEWTYETINEHQDQLQYLKELGYTEVGPQYIEHHLQQPEDWYSLEEFDLKEWHSDTELSWTSNRWKISGLRPTADVGMLWIK